MTTTEVAETILAARHVTVGDEPISSLKIAEILRHQAHKGTVRRLERGLYVFVPGSMSRTTQWRCERWERWFDEEQHRYSGTADARELFNKDD